MIPEFDKMIFDLNEGLQHIGILPPDRYITGFELIMSLVLTAIVMIAYNKIVVWSDWYEEHLEFFEQRLPKINFVFVMLAILVVSLYLKAYLQILIFLIAANIILIIATRKEFSGLREWLDKKFGWLF